MCEISQEWNELQISGSLPLFHRITGGLWSPVPWGKNMKATVSAYTCLQISCYYLQVLMPTITSSFIGCNLVHVNKTQGSWNQNIKVAYRNQRADVLWCQAEYLWSCFKPITETDNLSQIICLSKEAISLERCLKVWFSNKPIKKKTQIFNLMERKEIQYKTEVEKVYKYIQEFLISSNKWPINN